MVEIKSNAASVEFRGVTKIYGKSKVPAVNDISLLIETGKLVTLLGPSGCGKTTTLRMIAGLEFATQGKILIGDRDVTRLPATERDVSMVFQSYALFPHMTVRENVEYGLKFSGFTRKETTDKARAGLELVGLVDYGDRLPSQLSGGQQQRVAVARALVLEPQVLLFDEPLSNLDAKLRRHVREEIREIQQKLGLTVVYVTHDQEEALAVSDRIVVMNNAIIAQEGTPRELYDQPANAFVADFIGEANIFDCEVESVDNGRAKVRLGPLRLDLPAGSHKTGPAKIAARPRRILVRDAQSAGTMPGRLLKVTYVGSHLEFMIDTELGPVFAVSPEVDTPFAAGQAVGVALPERGPVLISA
ncbi:ABC transporter ATP-binding protein [Pseudaminobacter sp. 19-2017]|uniref:ABC transporter ATP-binding protein n=1 Tax=Pseudaminobacter soli (ex Zhang et al. 2022) TaxID=2831468 RepID=A0A942DZG8_9HYPH|nr:ABC transporter ATP-binding protein [Pseudaminobacter soli]MBS3650002.1 ABC transporter ATP-binding protein [Pseudaminobacter soli]